jgi:hypothetical protein
MAQEEYEQLGSETRIAQGKKLRLVLAFAAASNFANHSGPESVPLELSPVAVPPLAASERKHSAVGLELSPVRRHLLLRPNEIRGSYYAKTILRVAG